MKFKSILTAMVVAAFVTACEESDDPRPDLSAEQRLLNENRAAWERANIVSYQYAYRRQCFCPPEEAVIVMVTNRQVSGAFHTPSGTFLTTQELTNIVPMEGLFAKVQEAIDQKVFSLRVAYHPQFGFPTSIAIDPNQSLADDEITHLATNFQ